VWLHPLIKIFLLQHASNALGNHESIYVTLFMTTYTSVHAETLLGFVSVSLMNSADGRYWSGIILSGSPSDPAAYFVTDQINFQECGNQTKLALKIDALTNKVDKDLLAIANSSHADQGKSTGHIIRMRQL